MFGLFFNSFLNFFGVHTGYLSATLAGLIPILVVGHMTKKDIRISARIIGLFITIEAGFVALLCLYILIKQGVDGHLSSQPFNPAAADAGGNGFLSALLLPVRARAWRRARSPRPTGTRRRGTRRFWCSRAACSCPS